VAIKQWSHPPERPTVRSVFCPPDASRPRTYNTTSATKATGEISPFT